MTQIAPLPDGFITELTKLVGRQHVLLEALTHEFTTDWTGRYKGRTPVVIRPADADEVAAVLALCTEGKVPVVPQGGNTGLVGGGVPMSGEVVISLKRLQHIGAVDPSTNQITVGSGVTLAQVGAASPELDLAISIASRASATVGGAIATNAGGLRVLRYGPMRSQVKGVEAVLSDGTIISHLSGLIKDNTGYDYPSLLVGSEGTLAIITQARLQLIPRAVNRVTAVIGLDTLATLERVAAAARIMIPELHSAEFFTDYGLQLLVQHAGLAQPLPDRYDFYLLLEAVGEDASERLSDVIADLPVAVAETERDRARLWQYRERQPQAAGYLGTPLKLDVSVPQSQWVKLASHANQLVKDIDHRAEVVIFGHVVDGNVHVNIVPGGKADGTHETAVFQFVASLGGSISAEHGIGRLKAPWLHLVRSDAERSLFARIRSAFDPHGILNPNILPR